MRPRMRRGAAIALILLFAIFCAVAGIANHSPVDACGETAAPGVMRMEVLNMWIC